MGRERFRAWRRWLGESQAAVAARCGLSQPYIAQIEGGTRTPGLGGALAIEAASADWPDGPIRAAEWVEHSSEPDTPAAAGGG